MASRYLMKVQILRFYAALLVAIAHVGVATEEMARSKGLPFTMRYPLDWGLGVDIFFVISGFIMYFTMHDRFERPLIWWTFLKRRLIRIVPLYWICTTMMLVSILAASHLINHNAVDPIHILASYLFFPWPNANGEVFPVFTLGWTLNLEMVFYFCFAVALTLPRRIGLLLLTVGFFALWLISALASPEHWLLKFWGWSLILEFLMGIFLAHLFLKNVAVSVSTTIVTTVAALVLAVVFYQTDSYSYLPRAVTGGISAILIMGTWTLCRYAPKSRFSRALAVGGDASYALYLTHAFAAKAVMIVASTVGIPPTVAFCIALVAAVIVSLGVHFLVEKPINSLLLRWFDKPKPIRSLEPSLDAQPRVDTQPAAPPANA